MAIEEAHRQQNERFIFPFHFLYFQSPNVSLAKFCANWARPGTRIWVHPSEWCTASSVNAWR